MNIQIVQQENINLLPLPDFKNKSMKNLDKYVEENKDRFIEELIELLKIPSVSADTA